MKLRTKLSGGALALSLILTLSGCVAGSHVDSAGMTDEVVWPEISRGGLDNGLGTFPTKDELDQIRSGMSKDQMYKLIGRPHFDEGFFHVQEWDYIFHFYTPNMGENGVSTCQFKVLYDDDMLTTVTYWHPVIPQDGICPPQPQQQFELSADALFDFDQSNLAHMKAKGKASLDELARALKQSGHDQRHIQVVGHTDYLGDASYNQQLSLQRAQTVREYLIGQGIAASHISASGEGESAPVKECDASQGKSALIACLAPNRRVEVKID